MTIGIGVLCSNGIVLGSDGMASRNLGTDPFVGVDNLKTHRINGKMVFCCAGNDRYLQYFLTFLRTHCDNLLQVQAGKTPDNIASAMLGNFYGYLSGLQVTFPPHIQQGLGQNLFEDFNKGFSVVLGFIYDNRYYMYRFDGVNISPILDTGIWHHIIGLGLLHGEPTIHLIKKIMKIREMPDVNDAINLAYWTIKHAKEVSSGGIGGDIKITYIKKLEDDTIVIEDADLDQCEEFISSVYRHIDKYFEQDIIEQVEIAPALPLQQDDAEIVVEEDEIVIDEQPLQEAIACC